MRWVTLRFASLFRRQRRPADRPAPAGFVLQFFGFYEADMLTLEHYRNVWENSGFWRAFRNTLLLGFAGATATMALGGIVAYVTTRTLARPEADRRPGVVALMMPGMVLGIGFVWVSPSCRTPSRSTARCGAAAGLYRARHAGRRACHLGRLSADRDRHRGMLAGAWRRLVADTVGPHPHWLAWPAFAVGWC